MKARRNFLISIVVIALILASWPAYPAYAGDGPGGVGSTDGDSSLVLWLTAEDAYTDDGCSIPVADDGDPVGCLVDWSGNFRHVTEATNGPSYFTNVVNGQPVVRFDGIDDLLAGDLSVNGLDEMTIIAVNQTLKTETNPLQETIVFWDETDSWGSVGLDAMQDKVSWRFGTGQVNNNHTYTRTTPLGTDFTLTTISKMSDTENLYVNGENVLTVGGRWTPITNTDSLFWLGHTPGSWYEGDIAEVIVYNAALTDTALTHVDLYLMDKYDIDLHGTGLYSSSVYTQNVRGISASAGVFASGSSAGLSVTDTTFLSDADDVIVLGHDSATNSEVTTDLPAGVASRWERVWFLDISDVNSDGGEVQLAFDFSAAGIGGTPDGSYVLLERQGPGGEFSIVDSSVDIFGDQVFFYVDTKWLLDESYYTLGLVVPELVLTKGVDDDTPIPGQLITYTIVITNDGFADATNAVVSDTLPANLTFAGPVVLDPPEAGVTGSPPTLVTDLSVFGGEWITVTFPVTVNMGVAGGTVITNTAAVTSTEVVTPVTGSVGVMVQNVAPAAVDDVSSTNEDTPVTIGVLTNDNDANGDALSISAVGTPNYGAVTISNFSFLIYTPTNRTVDYSAVFTYTASDGSLSDTATVTVTVTADNDPPNAVGDTRSTNEDTPTTISVLSNDSDPEGVGLTVGAVGTPNYGSASTNGTTVTYTPTNRTANYTAVFTYTASDGFLTDTATVTVTVTADNDAPVAVDDTASTNEDTPVTADVLANDNDPEGNTLTVVAVGAPANGGASTDGATVTYTPTLDFNGADVFTYTASDGSLTDSATVTVTVNSVNDPPIAVDDTDNTDEDTPVTISVLANDSDVDSDTLTVSAVGTPNYGAVTISNFSFLIYTPTNRTVDYSAVFTYTASDGSLSDTAAVTVTVTTDNDLPVAVDDVAITAEDTPRIIAVLANDSDPDGDTLSIDTVGTPTHGIVAISNPQSLIYTPTLNFNGSDVFTYTVSDGDLSDSATVIVTVEPVNDPPTASDDTASTAEDTAVTISVLDNDTDIEGDGLSIGGLGSAGNGSVTTDGDDVTYIPTANFNGTDSFTYTVGDAGGGTDTATVTVTVSAVNDAPDAINDAATTGEDTPVVIQVLFNDTDVEGDTLTVVTVGVPAHGSAHLSGTMAIIYTPTQNSNGGDSFNYTISDGNGGSDTATVNVTVNPANDAPVAVNDAAVTDADTPVDVDVLANDSDVDGDTLSVSATTQASHGTVVTKETGFFGKNPVSVQYTPDTGFSGLDSFTYTADDGNGSTMLTAGGGSDTATVTIIVSAQEGVVDAVDDIATTNEDTASTIAVLSNDTLTGTGTLTILSASQPDHGTVAISNFSFLIYTPHPDYNGPDAFTYVASDGVQGADTATVTLYVDGVNDAPDAVDDTATLDEDTRIDIPVLNNDSDVDGDALTVSNLGQARHGRVILRPGGSLRYIPDADYNGSDSFDYTVSDGNGSNDTATVEVTVNPINDAPGAVDDPVTTDEDILVDIHVLSNDGDVEGHTLTIANFSQGQHGTVVTNTDGSLRYTPAPDYNGSDDFTYTTDDGNGGTDSAMVNITINPVDDLPEGVRDATILVSSTVVCRNQVFRKPFTKSGFSPAATTSTTPTAEIDVLANDVNVDGAELEVTRVGRARNGRVTIGAGGKIKYMPNPGFGRGTDTFTYTVGAVGKVYESIDAVNIVFNPEGGDVIAVDDTVTTDEDQPITFALLDNDVNNVPTTTLSLMGVIPRNGLVIVNVDDTVTYLPNGNLNGSDVFTYIVGNGELGGDTGVVTVTINPVNDPPDAVMDVISTTQGISITLDVLTNDTDVDGDELRVAQVIQGPNGAAVVNGDGTVTYTPHPGFRGLDTFAYVVRDDYGRDDIAVVAVVVTPVNQAPEVATDLVSTAEDTAIAVHVLANDFDEDGDAITVTHVTQGDYGTVVIGSNGTVTYTPDSNLDGADSFTYTASDGDLPATAAVNVTVIAANDGPNAVDDTVNTPVDTPRVIFVLGNDSDPEGDPLSISAVSTAANGSVSIEETGFFGKNPVSVAYTPTQGFTGIEAFTYTVSDGSLNSTAHVSVTVGAPNTAPTPANDTATTAEDTPVTIAVLDGDTDPDGDPLMVSGVTPALNGFASTDGYQVTYRPDLNFNGSDSFTYTVSDGGLSTAAVVTVTVTPVNDAPTAVDDNAMTARNTPVIIDVKANDTDVDGDMVNVIAVGAAADGTVILQSGYPVPVENRKLTYTPDQDFIGADVFTYTLTDGALSDTATVTVSVNPAALSITKTVSTASGTAQLSVLPGDVVTYTIELAHGGGDTVQSAVVFDTLPAGVRFDDWCEGGQGSALLPPPENTIVWGPYDVAGGDSFTIRFTAIVTSSSDLYGATVNNVAHYTSINAGFGSDDASFMVTAPDVWFVSPTAGQVFTATDNVSVTIPIEVATTNFTIPDDGHWQLWMDGVELGPVYTTVTSTNLLVGDHVISAELRTLAGLPVGPIATVNVVVKVEPQGFVVYLPAVMRSE